MSFQRPGFHTITTYLIIENAQAQIDFIKSVFDGELLGKSDRPDGSVMHVEMAVGDSKIMFGEPNKQINSIPASMYIYVPNCDDVYQQALAAGAESVMEPTTMIHAGQRYGGVKDINGNVWWIATHLEDVDS